MAKIDRRLNLVLTVDLEDGTELYVHAAPIGAATFERYFLTITKTYAAMAENGAEWMFRSGPRVALMMMKRIAEADGAWDGEAGIQAGLMPEVRRLASVMLPGTQGWTTVPLQEALDRNLLSVEDAREVENSICFFIVSCAAERRSKADGLMSAIYGASGAQVISLNATEYLDSLRTLSKAELTGETAKASSIPR